MSEVLGDNTEHEIQLVRDRLGRSDVNREVIALLAVRLIELTNPGMRVEMTAEDVIRFGEHGTMQLRNLWIECEQTPEDRAEIVERYVRVLVPAVHEVGPSGETQENIIALVRDSTYCEFVKEEDRSLITAHLIADLWIIYAVDRPESTTVLKREKALELGFDRDSLLSTGSKNVERLLGELQFTAYGECYTIGCETISYASSTLLLDYVWDQAASVVEGDVVVAVPARDTVIFTGSANAKGLDTLRDQVRYVTQNGHHVVSDILLRRVNGEWKSFL